jgi:hypothetical protein
MTLTGFVTIRVISWIAWVGQKSLKQQETAALLHSTQKHKGKMELRHTSLFRSFPQAGFVC